MLTIIHYPLAKRKCPHNKHSIVPEKSNKIENLIEPEFGVRRVGLFKKAALIAPLMGCILTQGL